MTEEPTTQSPEYLRRVNAALALRDVPDYEAALLQLTLAQELAPEDLSTLLLLGLTLQDLGSLDAAEEKLRLAYKIGPDSNNTIQALGLLLIEQKQYQEALSLLKSLIEANVHDPAVSQGAATALEGLDNISEAIDYLEEARSHFPDDPELTNQLCHLLLKANRIDEAEKVLTTAIDVYANPNNLLDLATVFIKRDLFQQALNALDQAIQLSSEDDRFWRARTRCLIKLKELHQANEAAQVALSLDDESQRNWHNLARAQFALKETDKAFLSLQRSADLSQSASDERGLRIVLFDRAMFTLRVFGVTRALEVIEQDLAKLPEHQGLRQLQIDLLIATSQYAEALDILDEVSDTGLEERDRNWEYFIVYFGLNRPKDAWSKLPKMPEDPGEIKNHILRMEMTALYLYQNNNLLAAHDIFRKVLEIDQTRVRSINNLGFLLSGDEKWEEAKHLLDQALHYLNEVQEDQSGVRDVILANLGYIHLRQQDYDKAIRALEQAERLASDGDKAILRIAYWLKNNFSSTDEERYPKRFTDPLLAIRANLATAYFLKGEREKSQEIAQSLVDLYPKSVVGYRVLGCILFSTNNPESARTSWEKALEKTRSKSERELITSWVDRLPQKVSN